MIVTYRFRLLPTKVQHRSLEQFLESQRQLYNAALEERIGAYRIANVTLTYIDQTKSLTEWRKSAAEASALPMRLQRATLKRLDEAYRSFFRRVKKGAKPGFPRFRGRGWFDSFGFSEFVGITLKNGRLRFKGLPGTLRVHWHRDLPAGASVRACAFKRDTKGWMVSFAVAVTVGEPRKGDRAVGVDLGISTFAALSDGGFIPSLKAARKAERRMRRAQRALARKKRIALEKLNVKGLAASALAKDVHDASWARFISMLTYKAAKAGTRLIEVDPPQHQSGLFWLRRESPEGSWRSESRLPALRAVDRSRPQCRAQHPEPGRSGPGPAQRSRLPHACRRKPRFGTIASSSGQAAKLSHYPMLLGAR